MAETEKQDKMRAVNGSNDASRPVYQSTRLRIPLSTDRLDEALKQEHQGEIAGRINQTPSPYPEYHQAIEQNYRRHQHAVVREHFESIAYYLKMMERFDYFPKDLIYIELIEIETICDKLGVKIRTEVWDFKDALETEKKWDCYRELVKEYKRKYKERRRAIGIERILENRGIRTGL